jgi:UBX domain-containing protein 1/4
MEEEEMKKIIDQRRREKLEDDQARQRIKAKIEADKQARQAKFSNAPAAPAAPVQPAKTEPPKAAGPPKDYVEAKINVIRLRRFKLFVN